jgi:signal transduction histidine kinase
VTLRRRLTLTLVLTAAPLLLMLVWVRRQVVVRSEARMTRDFVLSHVQSQGRERCESEPADALVFGHGSSRTRPEGPEAAVPRPRPERDERPASPRPPGPPRRSPLQGYAYDDDFHPSDERTPEFPAALRRTLESGADYASRLFALDAGGEGFEVAVRTGWTDGRCAVILARRMEAPRDRSPDVLWSALPLLVALLASVLVAAGPVVHRIRALTADVQHAADTRYEAPVRVAGSDEVTELARAFNEAGAKVRTHLATLEQRDQTLRQFLANTTHDVMIPLTVLQGHLAAVREGAVLGASIGEAQILPALQEAQYIASLLHNLSAAAKLEAAEPLVERHAVDMGALVERVVQRHRPVAVPAGISIEYGVPERPLLVEGDETLIEQAVSNLVHNAVRYNRSGGHVAILLEEMEPAGFRLRVVDDGPGVPDDELRGLTERHRRGNDARQRHPGGLGLGLDIAYRVAERHHFEMTIERSDEGGLLVTIRGARAVAQSASP